MQRYFLGDGASELVHALKKAIVVKPRSDHSIKRFGQRGMYWQLVLSLDQIATGRNKPGNRSYIWLRFSHSAIILFGSDVKTRHDSGLDFTKSNWSPALECGDSSPLWLYCPMRNDSANHWPIPLSPKCPERRLCRNALQGSISYCA